jgi:hypothetical protein
MTKPVPDWQINSHPKLYFWVINLVLPAIFLIIARAWIPSSNIFQFNPDEGIELAKVDLYQQGYKLYQQIWNDQPPLPTVLWAFWLHTWGYTLENARGLTLCFATLLVWAYGNCLRLTVAPLSAVAGVVLLIASVNFLNLSNAVMMGLPSLSLVILAVYALLLFQRSPFPSSRKLLPLICLAGSAIAFAMALQLKSFVAFLIPVFFASLLLSPKPTFPSCSQKDIEKADTQNTSAPTKGKASLKKRLMDTIFWIGVLAVATYLISLLLPTPDFSQTLGGHFNSELGRFENWFNGLGDFLELFLSEIDLFILCGLVVIFHPRVRQNLPVFPSLWLLLASLTLFIHRPLWSHYSMLLSLPIIWLTASTLQPIAIALNSREKSGLSLLPRHKTLILLVLCLCLICLPLKGWLTDAKTRDLLADSRIYQPVFRALMKHQGQTNWLFTDLPMFGFQAHLKVPPEIAVFSQKRLRSGNLTPSSLNDICNRYQPEQVLLGRFPEIKADLRTMLDQNYAIQYAKKNVILYLRNDLALSSDQGKNQTTRFWHDRS